VHALERLNVPFTGGTSDFCEPSREAMKRVCREWDIDAPAHVFASSEADVEHAADTLRFPLFVKHPSSHASVGLTRESRVETPETPQRQARLMMKPYGGALIEECVAGTECTVLVAENAGAPDEPLTHAPIQ
jgi:D-alanine-D-alanine ligase-like ATP-grasp enzyme